MMMMVMVMVMMMMMVMMMVMMMMMMMVMMVMMCAGGPVGELHSHQPGERDEEGPSAEHAASQTLPLSRPLRSTLFRCQVSMDYV